MSDNNTDDLPEALLEEAAIWQARLHASQDDCTQQQAFIAEFNQWLAVDYRHHQAYQEMEKLWGSLGAPISQLITEQQAHHAAQKITSFQRQPKTVTAINRPKNATRSWFLQKYTRLAVAACFVIAVIIGVGTPQDWASQWQSDYATTTGEALPINTEDGSLITLNTDSALAMDYTADERRVRLLKGEAWFAVSPKDHRPFIVETPKGAVRVTGTQFNVQLTDGNAIVSLDEGQVILTHPNNSKDLAVILVPGQQAMLSGKGISAPEKFDRTAVTGWLRGQFVFYNTPLAEVVATLNRYRAGHIVIANRTLNTLQVSGIFSTNEPDAALDMISRTLAVNETRLTDYLVLLR